jgi:hypothetical protein
MHGHGLSPKADGYPDDKVRNVTENARMLKFETYGFEDR